MEAPSTRAPRSETKWEFLGPPQRPDEIGRLAQYRVLEQIGQGGMGIVFQAEDQELRRPAALKVMRPDCAAQSEARARFLREARAAAALKHDHVVTIYQVGEDRGVPFLAMEFLTGKSLDDWLRPDRRASIPETLTIGRQIAKGLSAAHAVGLVHRDIKPANLWLEVPPGRVKILDFGLARHIAGELTQLTTTGALLGTPAFMAPEQVRGEATDQRCDLFSFGCVLYRMVTGRLPFQGNTVYAVLQAVASETPPAPCHINPAVPPRLAALIAALLEKNPDRRPASAEAVLGELLDIGNDSKSMSYVNAKHPQSNPKGGGSAARAHQNVVASIAPPIPEREPARRSVWVLSTLAIATLVMCALTIAIAIALRPKPGGPGPSPVAGSGQTTPPRSPDDGDATKRLAPDPAPSPVGTWDVTYRNGNTVVMIVAGDHTAIVDNGFRGQWEQTGHKVVLIETNNPPGTKPLRWDLEIDATGNGSRARIVPAARQQASRERAIEPTRIVHKGTYL